MSDSDLFNAVVSIDDNVLSSFSKDYVLRVISLVKDRAVFVSDIVGEAEFFFNNKIEFDDTAVKKSGT